MNIDYNRILLQTKSSSFYCCYFCSQPSLNTWQVVLNGKTYVLLLFATTMQEGFAVLNHKQTTFLELVQSVGKCIHDTAFIGKSAFLAPLELVQAAIERHAVPQEIFGQREIQQLMAITTPVDTYVHLLKSQMAYLVFGNTYHPVLETRKDGFDFFTLVYNQFKFPILMFHSSKEKAAGFVKRATYPELSAMTKKDLIKKECVTRKGIYVSTENELLELFRPGLEPEKMLALMHETEQVTSVLYLPLTLDEAKKSTH